MRYTDEIMETFMRYYAFDREGALTILIQHIGESWCDYAILSHRDGIVLMKLSKTEVGQAARICIELGITIDPVTKL